MRLPQDTRLNAYRSQASLQQSSQPFCIFPDHSYSSPCSGERYQGHLSYLQCTLNKTLVMSSINLKVLLRYYPQSVNDTRYIKDDTKNNINHKIFAKALFNEYCDKGQ